MRPGVVAIGLVLGLVSGARAQAPVPKGATVSKQASGTFDVKLVPQAADGPTAAAALGRMSIEKSFHGDLEATSSGQMLTAGTSVKDSAVYVAVEQVSGRLHGRRGSFVLYHRGLMTRGAMQLEVTVLPDSGTDELRGLSGQMAIRIENGKHFYELTYTLADEP